MRQIVTSVFAVASFSWFLWDATGRGWSRSSTDFPNYYTAAVLARTHQPLRMYYDWTWFQRQMHYAGIERQLGGYIPQTPATMAPFVPLSFLAPAVARKVWFVLNFAFLGLSLLLISRVTRFTVAELWLLSFPGYFALRSNFELGQYYIFLLALITLAAWLLLRTRELAGGLVLGAAIALKLYGAPFLLFVACRRKWRVVLGIGLALLFSTGCAIAVFGRSDFAVFIGQVLPRALQGETLNPYHPSNGTMATLLRRLFIAEAELNPQPLMDSPGVFFFLGSLFTLCVTLFPAMASALNPGPLSKRTLAWWSIGMLLMSPNTASYTFALLILPIALLLDVLPFRLRIGTLAGYFLLTLPLWPFWSRIFPKVWLLLGLFLMAGWPDLRSISGRAALTTFAVCGFLSAVIAVAQVHAWKEEPIKRFSRANPEFGAIYSASPQVTAAGLMYESIGPEQYVIRRGRQTFSFQGDALHPTAPDSGTPIYFELVAGRQSTIRRFDDQTGQSALVPIDAPNPQQPAVSHDGKSLAFISGDALFLFDGQATRRLAGAAHEPSFVPGDRAIVYATEGKICAIDLASARATTLLTDSAELRTPSVSPDGTRLLFAARRETWAHDNWQVWVKELANRKESKITGGNCNNSTPAWNGSRKIVFASDCRRGLGLPALFDAALQ
jgi:hypothetical protein